MPPVTASRILIVGLLLLRLEHFGDDREPRFGTRLGQEAFGHVGPGE